jgi:hypothetical protein
MNRTSARSPDIFGIFAGLAAFAILSIGGRIVPDATSSCSPSAAATVPNARSSEPETTKSELASSGNENLARGKQRARDAEATKDASTPTTGQIRDAISAGFGPALTIPPGEKEGALRYFVGDFNGDGFQDVAVAVSSDGNPDFKLVAGVRVSSPRSKSQSDIDLKQHIEGIAIIHGGPGGWEASASLPRFLLVWVGYPSKLAKKHGSVRLKYPLPPQAKGDALFCMGDGSGDGYVYFDGTEYRFKPVGRAD